jgi:hypothetical protein
MNTGIFEDTMIPRIKANFFDLKRLASTLIGMMTLTVGGLL